MTATLSPTFEVKNVAKLAWNAGSDCDEVAEAAGGHACVIEPKYDGIRLLAHVTEDGVEMFARSGNSKAGHLVHVESELAENFPAGTWLDGEAVAFELDDEGHIVHKWGGAQSVLGGNPKPLAQQQSITFVVFDLISHGGIDARALPFRQRRQLLESCFADAAMASCILSVVVPATEQAHEANLAAGFEGSMVKRLDAKYASGKRGYGMEKLKPQSTDEGVVTGFKPGEGSFAGLVGAIVCGQYRDGKLVDVTRFSGFDYATRLHMSAYPEQYVGRVVEFKHHGVMKDGFRHPQFLRFRDDKAPEQCEAPAAVAEKPKGWAKANAKPKAAPKVEFDPATALMTGRAGSGKLRNFKAMSDEKFAGVYDAILAEGNDPEAVVAVEAEKARRGA